MRVTGIILILLSILGTMGVLIYKCIKKTQMFIGPKSSTAFMIFGILLIMGIWLLARRKK